MLVEDTKQEIKTGGADTGRTKIKVEIVNNAANFRAVCAYTHPIHASLRELGQNAADAMVLAGKADEPFKVTMPTVMSPNLRVRDYGVGITPQEFEENVVHVGDSSKRGSEDQTGGFGRGLYAILGYTNMFTMRCVKDGRAWVHTCVIGEDGGPEWDVDFSDGLATDDPSGVEVIVPVERRDFWEFKDEAQNVYRWFGHRLSHYHVRPIVEGVEITDHDVVQSGERYDLLRNTHDVGSSVVMGNVRYPITLNDRAKAGLSEVAIDLIREGVIIYLPLSIQRDGKAIQPVVPTSQRDGLQYTQNTTRTISEALEEVAGKIAEESVASVINQPTQWAARLKYGEVFKPYTFLAKLRAASGLAVPYQGRNLAEPIRAFKLKKQKTANGESEVRVPLVRLQKFNPNRHRLDDRYWSVNELVVDVEEPKIYINDMGTKYRRRLEYNEKGYGGGKFIVTAVQGYDLNKWLRTYGLDRFAVKISELPEPPKEASGPGKKTCKELKFNVNAYGATEAWLDNEVDLNAGGVYVEVFRYSWKNKGEDEYKDWELLKNYKWLLEDIELVGLRKGPVKKLANDKKLAKKWMSLEQYMVKKCKQALKAREDYLNKEALDDFGYCFRSKLSSHLFSHDSLYGQARAAYDAAKAALTTKRLEKVDVLRTWIDKHKNWMSKRNLYDGNSESALYKQFKQLEKFYPMLDRVRFEDATTMVQYIRALDLMHHMA